MTLTEWILRACLAANVAMAVYAATKGRAAMAGSATFVAMLLILFGAIR